jgi:hypothetical protein
MTQQIGIPLDLSQLADLMAGKAPERRDTRPNPQMGAGMPDIQAVRLRELWAVYSQKPGAGAFQPGQLVTMDPAFAGVEPLRFPAQGYPAVVVSTSPQQDYSLLDQASDRHWHPDGRRGPPELQLLRHGCAAAGGLDGGLIPKSGSARIARHRRA